RAHATRLEVLVLRAGQHRRLRLRPLEGREVLRASADLDEAELGAGIALLHEHAHHVVERADIDAHGDRAGAGLGRVEQVLERPVGRVLAHDRVQTEPAGERDRF
ncbi:MAG: hypothetical protein ACK56I_02965, partial [bacterium]